MAQANVWRCAQAFAERVCGSGEPPLSCGVGAIHGLKWSVTSRRRLKPTTECEVLS